MEKTFTVRKNNDGRFTLTFEFDDWADTANYIYQYIES